eukprot:gnl/MRDRNA2_/MRDRNA2_88020_c0_seq1.p1 gnl/MRDRNA2_/MRDRNA2_88020_c0~~gnl/MRDRNA2_/MRDRNA2_88020_c0_seq1.p1  ORF type:complete len:540 (+),score=106.34 gnl/MRDRNA2_/MRDRNA2_88020_c0_seq1:72-1691(+)
MTTSQLLRRFAAAEHVVMLWLFSRILRQIRRKGAAVMFREFLNTALRSLKAIPGVSGAVQQEVDKEVAQIEKKMLGDGDPDALMSIPGKGMATENVLRLAKQMRDKEEDFYVSGKKWAGIYHAVTEKDNDLTKLQIDMWGMYASTNALYPGVFPSVRKFEAEITSMCIDLLHGRSLGGVTGQDAVGLLTSGGTESILIAIHAYREQAHERGIIDPEIICCVTAHPALDKAAHYFGVRLVKLQADQSTQQLSASSVRSAISASTIAIYASAPTFPHGVVDPIEDLSALALEKSVGLHVDNCLGGFYLSFLQRQGLFKRKFDFELPGVTTISIDVHKYGFASKGVSVVAFRNNELRRQSYVPVMDGLTLYITPTLQGARGGAVMAQAWGTLVHYGMDGYTKATRHLYDIEQSFKRAIEETPGIKALCHSDLAVFPMASDEPGIDIYVVASLLESKGWNMFTARDPPCMSVCFGERHGDLLESWVADLRGCLAEIRQNPGAKPTGDAAVYGAAKALPPDILGDVMRGYCDVKMKVKKKESCL